MAGQMARRDALLRLAMGGHDAKVFLRAWTFVYLMTTMPRLISVLARQSQWKTRYQSRLFHERLIGILAYGFKLDSLATVCGLIAGGTSVLSRVFGRSGNKAQVTRFISAFIMGCIGMTIVQQCKRPRKTIDMTAFAAARAFDVLLQHFLRGRYVTQIDTLLFTLSAWSIMFRWLYYPDRLDSSYRGWITKLADMDERLLDALRYIWQGRLTYGQSSKYSNSLEDYCLDIGMNPSNGNFNKSIPIPCIVVHGNTFESCEVFALHRWYTSFCSAMKMYLPLFALVRLRQRGLSRHILSDASRSSAFLATFIASIWYMICLTRTRIGPRLNMSPHCRDTWAPAIACGLCGLSVLLEKSARRTELTLFLAPRFIATMLPGRMEHSYRWLELFVFGGSVGVLLAAVGDKSAVRGVYGRTLTRIMR